MREHFHVVANRLLLGMIRVGVRTAGLAMKVEFDRRVARFAAEQQRLRSRYQVVDGTPLTTYTDQLRGAIEHFGATQPNVRYAYTSGSTAQPKKVAFTRRRLRSFKIGSFSVISRMMRQHRVDRTALFILSGLKEDDSFTALVVGDGGKQPPYLGGLLMPGRYLSQPALRDLVAEYGATAVRYWMLVLSEPGILYSTNPSTLALFLIDVHERWANSSRLICDYLADPGQFAPAVRSVLRRTAFAGWRRRFELVSASAVPLPLWQVVPGVQVYCCWDGGYVRPFLEQIRVHMPDDRYLFVPMYSMSTETVETLTHFGRDRVSFLPVASEVLYEFLPDGCDDRPEQLLQAVDLEPARVYTMVVSDAYGLKRYQTEDLFLCTGHVGDVPDLRFIRRRGIAYSFTGEKLTDQHLVEAFGAVREQFPRLVHSGAQLTFIPSREPGALVPGYRLVIAHPGKVAPELPEPTLLAAALDRELGRVNAEYASKVDSNRLAPTEPRVMPYDDLAAGLDPKTVGSSDSERRTWDTQFKLLPLYTTLWQDYGFDRS